MKIRLRFSPGFLVGLVGLLLFVTAASEWRWNLHREREDRLAFIRNFAPAPPGLTAVASVRSVPVAAAGLGVLKIERLGVEVLIRQGAGDSALAQGVGWIAGTAKPGQHGNVGLAGHRDSFFRALQDIQTGDQLKLLTPAGERTFRVERTYIVEPSDVSVLGPTRGDALTLVTCYPFHYVGTAPQRFIVRALLAHSTGPA